MSNAAPATDPGKPTPEQLRDDAQAYVARWLDTKAKVTSAFVAENGEAYVQISVDASPPTAVQEGLPVGLAKAIGAQSVRVEYQIAHAPTGVMTLFAPASQGVSDLRHLNQEQVTGAFNKLVGVLAAAPNADGAVSSELLDNPAILCLFAQSALFDRNPEKVRAALKELAMASRASPAAAIQAARCFLKASEALLIGLGQSQAEPEQRQMIFSAVGAVHKQISVAAKDTGNEELQQIADSLVVLASPRAKAALDTLRTGTPTAAVGAITTIVECLRDEAALAAQKGNPFEKATHFSIATSLFTYLTRLASDKQTDTQVVMQIVGEFAKVSNAEWKNDGAANRPFLWFLGTSEQLVVEFAACVPYVIETHSKRIADLQEPTASDGFRTLIATCAAVFPDTVPDRVIQNARSHSPITQALVVSAIAASVEEGGDTFAPPALIPMALDLLIRETRFVSDRATEALKQVPHSLCLYLTKDQGKSEPVPYLKLGSYQKTIIATKIIPDVVGDDRVLNEAIGAVIGVDLADPSSYFAQSPSLLHLLGPGTLAGLEGSSQRRLVRKVFDHMTANESMHPTEYARLTACLGDAPVEVLGVEARRTIGPKQTTILKIVADALHHRGGVSEPEGEPLAAIITSAGNTLRSLLVEAETNRQRLRDEARQVEAARSQQGELMQVVRQMKPILDEVRTKRTVLDDVNRFRDLNRRRKHLTAEEDDNLVTLSGKTHSIAGRKLTCQAIAEAFDSCLAAQTKLARLGLFDGNVVKVQAGVGATSLAGDPLAVPKDRARESSRAASHFQASFMRLIGIPGAPAVDLAKVVPASVTLDPMDVAVAKLGFAAAQMTSTQQFDEDLAGTLRDRAAAGLWWEDDVASALEIFTGLISDRKLVPVMPKGDGSRVGVVGVLSMLVLDEVKKQGTLVNQNRDEERTLVWEKMTQVFVQTYAAITDGRIPTKQPDRIVESVFLPLFNRWFPLYTKPNEARLHLLPKPNTLLHLWSDALSKTTDASLFIRCLTSGIEHLNNAVRNRDSVQSPEREHIFETLKNAQKRFEKEQGQATLTDGQTLLDDVVLQLIQRLAPPGYFYGESEGRGPRAVGRYGQVRLAVTSGEMAATMAELPAPLTHQLGMNRQPTSPSNGEPLALPPAGEAADGTP